MQSIKLQSHAGADGLLKLEVAVGMADTDFEVVVIVQPIAKAASLPTTTPEDLGWPPGFFERTYGILADDPIEPIEPLEYEEREEIL
jgi:hypothetical protein